MHRLILSAVVLFISVGQSSGVKWVEMKPGDPVPPKAVSYFRSGILVGRARHFDEIHPAEVYNKSAIIKVCGKRIDKYNFEVLTSTEPCSWQPLVKNENLPENIVLVGHNSDYEPLFVGMSINYGNEIYSFSLNKNSIEDLIRKHVWVLVCKRKAVWVDASSKKIQKNAVSGGKSEENKEMFVARLKHECNVYPGQVIPEDGVATALVKEDEIVGHYCQVLLGDPDQYSWMPVGDDKFPDDAVIGSTGHHELYYVIKDLFNNNLTYLSNFENLGSVDYEILVENTAL